MQGFRGASGPGYAFVLGAAALSLLTPIVTRADIVFGQVDDFQDGTTNNWTNGAGTFATEDGGPLGAGDLYLEVIGNGGSGPGSHLAVHNSEQWAGSYLAAGVTAIRLDMANFGESDLAMRFMIFSGLNLFTSTVPADVPADGQWRSYVLGMNPADLTQVGGSGDAESALANVQQLLIRHDTDGTSGIPGGTPVIGTLGMDNISAIPEPAAFALLALCALTAARPRRVNHPGGSSPTTGA